MSHPMSELGAAVARRARGLFATALAIAVALAASYVPVQAQEAGTILGTVTTASGDPLVDVVLTVVGTDPLRTAVSDNRGRYVIPNVPAGQQEVTATFIGYSEARQQVDVPAAGSVQADFRLQSRAVQLEGMVVTGTAINAQKREVGNSIDLITSEDIEASGATSVEEVLRGRVEGLQVSGSTGQPGIGSELNMRGLTSINGRRTPLIYVDGVRVGSEDTTFDPSTGSLGAVTVLGSISPQDIERIEVIKGAAASTLYGTDATAGVIQIFTKRGAQGERARWTFSTQQSLVTPPHFGPGEDIDPTGMHLNRCDIAGPIPDDPGPDPDCPESGSWFKNAWSQNYALQVRGGQENFSYFASGNVELEDGIINIPPASEIGLRDEHPGSNAENLFLRANFTFNPFEDLEIQINNSYTRRDISFVPGGASSRGLVWNVTLLDLDETENQDADVFLQTETQEIDQYTTSASINWVPMDNMRHRLNVGFDQSDSERINEYKRGHFAEALGERTVDIETSRQITLDYAGSLQWRLPGLDAYSLTTSWGGQLNDRRAGGLRGDAEDFINRGRTQLEQGAELTNLNESQDAFINGGFFLQQQVGWNNQIFVTGGFRFDSYNTVNQQLESEPLYQVFPKLQATYTVSDHAWFPSDVIETFRLRGAWGTAGDPPPQTASRTLWDIRNTGRGNTGFVVDQLGNIDIEPERTSEWEIGADVSALQGRLNLSGQYFRRSTEEGLIFNDPIPSLGIIEPTPANAGEWDTWGYEVTLDANVLDLDNFRWNVNSTFSTQDSEIFDIGIDEDDSFNVGTGAFDDVISSFRVGFPLGSVFDNRIVNADVRGALPVYSDTAEFLGVQVAPHELSVSTSFTLWNRLTLEAFGYGQFGHILSDGQAVTWSERGRWPACVETNQLMDAWAEAGANPDDIPDQLTAGLISRCWEDPKVDIPGGEPDSRDWLDDADFFRLSSLSAQYRLPEEWLPTALTGATVQFQALNLHIFTDFIGTDPDALRSSGQQQRFRDAGFTIPLPRTYSVNVRLNF